MKKTKASKNNKDAQGQPREHFDQEEENFDALEMKQHEDPEYHALLKSSDQHANKRKNAYFFSDEKYKGTSKPQEQEESPQEEISSEPEEVNQIAGAIKTFRQQRKEKSKLLTQDVKEIDKEDQQYQVLRKKQKTSDETFEEAIGLRNQLNFEKMLVDYRYGEQSTLQSLKKFPTMNFPNNEELHTLQKNLEQNLITNLDKLVETYSKYAEKVFETESLSTFSEEYQNNGDKEDKKIDSNSIHKTFMDSQDLITRNTEKQLIKWSHKTNLINVSTSHYSSLLMQTPVGQAKKIVSSWDRAKNKCQHKRGTFRILFRDEENVRETSDPQIFDDFELFTELQKGFINDVQDEQDFRMSDTLKYLKNRENRAEKTKQVDRKASKNRKLRFNVHAKLLNFMPSHPENIIDAREEIVSNFFNCKVGQSVQEKRQEEGQTFYLDM